MEYKEDTIAEPWELGIEERELHLFAVNTGEIYPDYCRLVRGTAKHLKKGDYNRDITTRAWYAWYHWAAKAYYKEFGYHFSTKVKHLLAEKMECRILAGLQSGDPNITSVANSRS